MSYVPGSTKLLVPGMGSGPAIWHASGTDAHTAADETDYFSDGKKYGMKVGDVVIYYDTDTNTTTIHSVSAVDSDGNATMHAATLA